MTAADPEHARPAAASMASSTGAPQRLHALDALRAFALVLGVALHAGLSYLPGGVAWVLMDGERSVVLAVCMYAIHIFRMMTFFLLAGFFARLACERRGARGFAADRARRVALPLLLCLGPTLLLVLVLAVHAGGVARTVGLAAPPPMTGVPRLTAATFPLAHLWFLYVLLLCYGAALALRAWLPDTVARAVDRALPRLLSAPGALLLAAPLAASLLADPRWAMWWGIPTPDHGFVPNLPAGAGFGLAFAVGWALQRKAGLLDAWRRRWAAHLALALLATLGCLAIAGPVPTFAPVAAGALRTTYGILYALAAWLWPFALTGLCLRFLDRPSPVRRYLADASYWIYLVHLPLVMMLQIGCARLSWPWQAEYPLLLALAFGPMLAAYHWGVRRTWVGARLNGKRIGTNHV